MLLNVPFDVELPATFQFALGFQILSELKNLLYIEAVVYMLDFHPITFELMLKFISKFLPC